MNAPIDCTVRAVNPSSGVVDLMFGLGALGTVWMLVRSWSAFWDADFDVHDRQLATQAAVFLAPPVIVLLHELGHLVVARMLGAHVTSLHYGIVEGAVSYTGDLTPAQDWWVALAGNLVGTLVSLALLTAGLAGRRLPRALRHTLIIGGAFNLAFAVVGYPVLSGVASFGDWLVIYDFSATPVLATVTAVIHVMGLLALWRWWRGGVRETLFTVDHGMDEEVTRLRAAIAADRSDTVAALDLANLYARNGDIRLGRQTVESALARLPGGLAGPAAARLQLARARLAMYEGQWHPAFLAAREGLQALDGADPTDDVAQRLWANMGLALSGMERSTEALDAFGRVRPPVADDVRVRYARGVARRQTGDLAGARADLEAVARWGPEGNLLSAWAEARLAGREPEPPDDRDRPAWQRRTRPPPAPLAGV